MQLNLHCVPPTIPRGAITPTLPIFHTILSLTSLCHTPRAHISLPAECVLSRGPLPSLYHPHKGRQTEFMNKSNYHDAIHEHWRISNIFHIHPLHYTGTRIRWWSSSSGRGGCVKFNWEDVDSSELKIHLVTKRSVA